MVSGQSMAGVLLLSAGLAGGHLHLKSWPGSTGAVPEVLTAAYPQKLLLGSVIGFSVSRIWAVLS